MSSKNTIHLYIVATLLIVFFTIQGFFVMRFMKSYADEFLERSDTFIETVNTAKDAIIWWEREAI